jgi:hypothetical protein
MESVWNYIYWQTLAINEFDGFTHFLRVLLTVGSECAPYAAAEQAKDKERAQHCNAWLGPYQPGINKPDPTEDGGGDKLAEKRQKKGETRGAGDPEAPPDPGQPDISQPQVVLPPGLQDLQNQVGALGQDATSDAPAPDQLLDFLLGP